MSLSLHACSPNRVNTLDLYNAYYWAFHDAVYASTNTGPWTPFADAIKAAANNNPYLRARLAGIESDESNDLPSILISTNIGVVDQLYYQYQGAVLASSFLLKPHDYLALYVSIRDNGLAEKFAGTHTGKRLPSKEVLKLSEEYVRANPINFTPTTCKFPF